jgi:hypothetical protein
MMYPLVGDGQGADPHVLEREVELDRRSGAARRSGERRSGSERRVIDAPPMTDFRSGADRRTVERRRQLDRRQCPADTPATYSRTEAAAIRAQVRECAETLVCPRCGGGLRVGSPIRAEQVTVTEVCCPACRRCLMLRGTSDSHSV